METYKNLIHEDLVKENKTEFISKVKSIAYDLGINPNWLMMVMYKESKINHKAYNKTGGATGLIQFMPLTAVGLGTTTTKLMNMSNIEQLDYVKKYFYPYRKDIKSYPDLYLVTFFPLALKKSNDWIFSTSKLSAYIIGAQNKVINNGQPITKNSFYEYVWRGVDSTIKKQLA